MILQDEEYNMKMVILLVASRKKNLFQSFALETVYE